MSDDWEIPRATTNKKPRWADSPIVMTDLAPLAERSATELKTTILADAAPIWPAARKLVAAENWFITHTGDEDRFAKVSKRAMELTGICLPRPAVGRQRAARLRRRARPAGRRRRARRAGLVAASLA